jgi:hypothetical protein
MTTQQPEAVTGADELGDPAQHPIYDDMVRGSLGAVLRNGASGG